MSVQETTDIQTRKKRLRAYAKERRAETVNRDIKTELLTANALTALARLFPETTGAGTRLTVFCYLSFSSEAGTDELIERLQETGWKVVCPRIENGKMYAVEYGEDFTLSSYGIREPIGERYTGEIHACITPLLAVDEQGNRLGYGGGFYDRFFTDNPSMQRIGYCFETQILREVPTETTDMRLHCIATEERIFFTDRKNK